MSYLGDIMSRHSRDTLACRKPPVRAVRANISACQCYESACSGISAIVAIVADVPRHVEVFSNPFWLPSLSLFLPSTSHHFPWRSHEHGAPLKFGTHCCITLLNAIATVQMPGSSTLPPLKHASTLVPKWTPNFYHHISLVAG